jgi:hypothetical protein
VTALQLGGRLGRHDSGSWHGSATTLAAAVTTGSMPSSIAQLGSKQVMTPVHDSTRAKRSFLAQRWLRLLEGLSW